MGRIKWVAGVVGGLLAVAPVRAADPPPQVERLDAVVIQVPDPAKGPPDKDAPKAKEPPKGKEPPKAKDVEPDAIARTDLAGEAPAGYFSRMMGDWLGASYANQIVTLPGFQVITKTLTETHTTSRTVQSSTGELITIRTTSVVPIGTTTSVVPVLVTTQAQIPILSRGSFKIAENEKPSPEDRFILSYSGFDSVPGAMPSPPGSIFNAGTGGPLSTVITKQTTSGPLSVQPVFAAESFTAGGNPTLVRTVVPSSNTFVHREVIGFEKTLLDGAVSVGVRAPFFQQQGDGSLGGSDLGDLTFVFKYLTWTNGPDALTVGLAVTAPTGPAIQTTAGDIHSSLLQPFIGGRVSAGDFFAIGFTSVAFPIDNRDVTILFNDVGVGFMMYRGPADSLVSWVAPTAEVHVTTPLTHRNHTGLVSVPDLVTLTEGVQVGLGSGASINLGIAVPVTGPRPFDLEAILQLNFRY